MSFYIFNLFAVVCLGIFIPYAYSTDLSPEIVETLMADHESMKDFRNKYHKLSCKLVVVAKMRAMFETKDIDKIITRVAPENRGELLDDLREAYTANCNKLYKEDKIIFESQLFYSYPNPDTDYQAFFKIDEDSMISKYPKYTAPPKPKKSKKSKAELGNDQAEYEEEPKPAQNEKEEKVDL